MNKIKPLHKFKIFNYDAAPFFFYIEIFPPDLTVLKYEHLKNLLGSIKTNPIMPLPMRVDRVFNGVKSLLIRPREPISFSLMDDLIAIINPTPFLQYGVEKLLYFTEVRGFEHFLLPLKIEKALKWWDSTKVLYAKLLRLEEDFSAFIKAYIHTVLKAKLNEEDLINAATNYCQMVSDICEKRIEENSILIETISQQSNVKLYKEKIAKYIKKRKRVKQVEYHPELVDIDIFNLSEKGFKNDIENQNSILNELKPKEIKYIPLLFYDDLLECMLQNLKLLNEGEDNLLDSSFLIDKNIIVLQKFTELENNKLQKYSWFNTFEEINLESIVQSISTIKHQFFQSMGDISKNISKPTNS
ncbi:MAG: hypothetical protein ACFE9I_01725 [Candidatus Hermodarchaeota archaeon]